MNIQVPREDQGRTAGKGFGVAASPLNSVKLELGILLCVGSVFWLVVDSITADLSQQLLILGTFSGLSTLWLVIRTRRTLRRLEREHETE